MVILVAYLKTPFFPISVRFVGHPHPYCLGRRNAIKLDNKNLFCRDFTGAGVRISPTRMRKSMALRQLISDMNSSRHSWYLLYFCAPAVSWIVLNIIEIQKSWLNTHNVAFLLVFRDNILADRRRRRFPFERMEKLASFAIKPRSILSRIHWKQKILYLEEENKEKSPVGSVAPPQWITRRPPRPEDDGLGKDLSPWFKNRDIPLSWSEIGRENIVAVLNREPWRYE